MSGSKEEDSSFETDAEKQAVAELRKHFCKGRALADPVRDAAALPNKGDSVYTDILHKTAHEKGSGDIQSLCNVSSFDSTVKEKGKRDRETSPKATPDCAPESSPQPPPPDP